MYQEIEGQRPVIVSRNHNGRIKPPIHRWTTPPDWSPQLNKQWALMAGVFSGVSRSLYFQIHNPVRDLLTYYAKPNSWAQLSTFTKQVTQMENFRSGIASSLAFQSAYGLSFEGARWWLWRYLAGGHPLNPDGISITPPKTFATAFTVGMLTCWIPVPFYNISIRYDQDKILPREIARGYRNHFHAAYTIAKLDGLFPFVRSAGPLMGEYASATSAMFFWLDFFKEKLRFLTHFSTAFPGYNEFAVQVTCVGLGAYMSCVFGYPFRIMRHYVDELPRNSKGEKYLASYSEAFWKYLVETANGMQLWNGFNRYVFRAGPPLFLTMLFADTLGLSKQTLFIPAYVTE
mmetsp:Transcript_34073/g.59421  ORF Transcript_34073/g.59421 Transcript_34073/m.59421 type:complete len:345 (+) Transcript_34073:513-1547(+)